MKKFKHIAVDTMVLIYLIEKNPKYLESAKLAYKQSESILLSTMGLGEILSGFDKKSDQQGKLTFLSFLEYDKKISIIGFGKQEAISFAQLRAKYPSIKPPDAIHLSTAILSGAEAFVTNDKNLKQVEEIPVITLS